MQLCLLQCWQAKIAVYLHLSGSIKTDAIHLMIPSWPYWRQHLFFPVGCFICSAATTAHRNIMSHHSGHLSPLRSCQSTQKCTLCPGNRQEMKRYMVINWLIPQMKGYLTLLSHPGLSTSPCVSKNMLLTVVVHSWSYVTHEKAATARRPEWSEKVRMYFY